MSPPPDDTRRPTGGADNSDGPSDDRRRRRHRERLIGAVISAWRPRDRDGAVTAHPAWYDLTAEDREAAYRRTCAWRRIEAAIDPDHLTTTARAVLRQISKDREANG